MKIGYYSLAILLAVLASLPAEAQMLLKVGVARSVKLGPFIDATDGVTPEPSLTISQSDIRLSKNGAAFAQTHNTTGATHDENGYYNVPLDTTDTNDVGHLRVAVNESGAGPVWQDFMVVPANVFDSLVGGSANLATDAVKVGGTTQTGFDMAGRVSTALPNAAPNANGGLPILSSSGTALGYTVPTVTSVTNRVTANVDQVDGVALGSHAAGYFPADSRRVDGVALGSHASGYFPSDILRIATNGTAAANLLHAYDGVNGFIPGAILGQVDTTFSGGATFSVVSPTIVTDGDYVGAKIVLVGVAGTRTEYTIIDSNASTQRLTVDGSTALAADSSFYIVPGGRTRMGSGDANAIDATVFADNTIDAAAIAANAIGASELADNAIDAAAIASSALANAKFASDVRVGVDWSHVSNPSSSVALNGTTVNTVNTATNVTNPPGATLFTVSSATGNGSAIPVNEDITHNDQYKYGVIKFNSAADDNLLGRMFVISGSDAANDLFTVAPNVGGSGAVWADGDTFWVIPQGAIAGLVTDKSDYSIGMNGIVSTSFGTGAITAASFASNAITDTKIASGAITGAKFDGTTAVAQTGNVYPIVNNGTYGNSALKTLIDDLPTNSELDTALHDVIVDGALTVEEFSEQAAPYLIANGIASNYAAGRIWIDTLQGVDGDTALINGTVNTPVKTIVDAFDIADNLGNKIKDFNIANSSSITLSETSTGKNFFGSGWTLALGSQNIGGSYFNGAKSVTGIGTGTLPVFERCTFGTATLPPTTIVNSSFGGTLTASGAGQFLVINGESAAASSTEPMFDFSGVSGTTQANFRRWSGGIDIKIKAGVTVNLDVVSGGVITLSGDGGAGATVNIRGSVRSVVDNTTNTVIVNQE